jgi:hypothetical protein
MSGPIILPNPVSTPDMEEFVLLEGHKKIVMGIGAVFQDSGTQVSFQKCMEMGWIRLFDVMPILPNPALPPGPQNIPVPCRIFKITNTGQDRLMELQRRKNIDKRLQKQ